MSKEFGASLSGVEVIYQFHTSLITDLEEMIKSWSTSTKLGELFERVVCNNKKTKKINHKTKKITVQALYLKFYSQYVTHYQTVVQLLAKKKADKNLQTLLEKLKPESRGKGLKDYMIMPIQRIPRYQMLLTVCFMFIIILLKLNNNIILGIN